MAPLLPRFLVLYGSLFAAFGVASPFLPGLLGQDGLSAPEIGVVLASGTAIRLVSGPLGGRLADRATHPSRVLAAYAAASAVVACLYGPARGLALLLLVSVAHASVLAPLTPVADALALGSAVHPPGFRYGSVRGAGSAAFICGTLVSGQLVQRFGLATIIWSNAVLLALAAGFAWRVPDRFAGGGSETRGSPPAPWRDLFGQTVFMRLMVVAALIGGSHALHDGFEVIRWRSGGLSAVQASMLWALSVAGEVVVFFYAGRRLLARLGPSGAMVLAAVAGVVRWGAAASTAAFPVMAVVEPLHGLTFALLHLACMQVMAHVVPQRLAATAQAFYATVAMGATYAAVTLATGPLYQRFGASSFWAMASLCLLAVPLAWRFRVPD